MQNTTRRSVLRAVAWSVPAITVATAAPAFADSNVPPRKDPGINGWVQVNYPAGKFKSHYASFDSDPAGTDPRTPDGNPYGLYLFDTQPGDLFSAASITLWFRAKVGSWTYGSNSGAPNGGGHGVGWGKNPSYVGTQTKPDGLTYHGYRFNYTGSFSALGVRDGLVWLQDFEAKAWNVGSSDATFWVERQIAVNGQMYAFQRRNGARGPLGNGFPVAAPRARMVAPETTAQDAGESAADSVAFV